MYIDFLMLSLILSVSFLYIDKIIEWLFPNSDFSRIEDTTDDLILHIGSHEDMH